ncbi:hypothetical protein GEMRC1_002801 [Eukaryota sp. GEM-RC1]
MEALTEYSTELESKVEKLESDINQLQKVIDDKDSHIASINSQMSQMELNLKYLTEISIMASFDYDCDQSEIKAKEEEFKRLVEEGNRLNNLVASMTTGLESFFQNFRDYSVDGVDFDLSDSEEITNDSVIDLLESVESLVSKKFSVLSSTVSDLFSKSSRHGEVSVGTETLELVTTMEQSLDPKCEWQEDALNELLAERDKEISKFKKIISDLKSNTVKADHVLDSHSKHSKRQLDHIQEEKKIITEEIKKIR